MVNRTFFTVTFILIFMILVFRPSAAENRLVHLTMEDGLSSNIVYDMQKDSLGFIWFLTSNGLDRYDGYTIENLIKFPRDAKLSMERDMDMFEKDSMGNFWIGGLQNGIVKINPYEFTRTHYYSGAPKPFTINDNSITTIFRDSKGNMWIGTFLGGINKYSSSQESFAVSTYLIDNNNTRQKVKINGIFEDNENQVWAVANKTLNKFDEKTSSFIQANILVNEPDQAVKQKDWDTQFITEDEDGNFWFYYKSGIMRYNPSSSEKKLYPISRDDQTQNSISTTKVFIDSEGLFWMVFQNSFVNFNTKNERYNFFHLNEREFKDIEARLLPVMAEDKLQNLWIGSTDGIIQYSKRDQKLYEFPRDPELRPLLSNIHINQIISDCANNLWFFTENGIFKYNTRKNLIENHPLEITDYKSDLKNKLQIYSYLKDSGGQIWIGSSEGLLRYNHNKHTSVLIYRPQKVNNIIFIFEENDKYIWASSARSIIRYNKISNQIEDFSSEFSKLFNNKGWVIFQGKSIRNNQIVFATYKGFVFFDTFKKTLRKQSFPDSISAINNIYQFVQKDNYLYWVTSSGNLIKYNLESYQFNVTDLNKFSLNKGIKSLFLDSKNYLWIGYKYGAIRYNIVNNNIESISIMLDDSTNLSRETLSCIFQDNSGNIWLGFGGFLVNYQQNNKKFNYYIESGRNIYNDNIVDIFEDSEGYLWILRDFGLSRFDKKKGYFTNYLNATLGDYFRKIFQLSNETFIIISKYGSYSFYPKYLINEKIPEIVLTQFSVMNKPFLMGSSIALKRKINLDYDQNFFSFEFAALDYLQPEKNQYAYMLEGLDKDWIDNGNRQYASYSKVEPGHYIFRVKGSNSDGYWNEKGASIRIVILPPWWETTWAKIIYVLIFGIVVAGFWRFQTNRIQMKHQLELEKLQAEKLQEIDRMKSHFFANISHEFRTPLTLILGPLENLKTRISDSRSHQELNMIQRSAHRLYTLIGQLLDLSKLESGHMKLQAEQIDFIGFLKPIILSFATWAEKKNITLQFKHPEQPLNLYIDTEIMEKVVNNLLSNAMKFTPEGGRVTVTTGFPSKTEESPDSNSSDYISLNVSDTGPGIQSDKIEHIFDRFYQADNGTLNAQEGTGIGLALTHELVERHYGKIEVSSSQKKGTTFTVLLPLGPDCFRDGEIIPKGDKPFAPQPEPDKKPSAATDRIDIRKLEQTDFSSVQDAVTAGPSKQNTEKNSHYPLVLVVEDNPDLTLYMSNYLEEHYRVIASADGISGYQDTVKFMPDLIISDIMMPGMDGFELCSKVKSEGRTSHIPVILLTARADGESKLKGLDTGADDYITKPFDIRELLLRVRNIIEQRRRLKERFSRDISIKPSDITVTSLDEQFLKKAIEITEQHMSDSKFSTSSFSREIGMSRQHLNEKLQALTGHSTREFMRIIRLKRAAQLLTQKSGNVTDVAFETGFNNLSHFAKIFREQFGVSPSDFASACKKQTQS